MHEHPRHCQERPRIAAPQAADAVFLSSRMLPGEQLQMAALYGWDQFDADRAARALVAGMEGLESWAIVGSDGRAIAIGGLSLVRAGVRECWAAVNAADWPTHHRNVARACRSIMRQAMLAGIHRIETHAHADRVDAHAWYEKALGMKREGVHPGYFSNGDAAISFAITRGR